jgi:hypothetical protein
MLNTNRGIAFNDPPMQRYNVCSFTASFLQTCYSSLPEVRVDLNMCQIIWTVRVVGGFYCCVIEDYRLRGCVASSPGKWFPMFRRNMSPSSLGFQGP